MLVWILRPGKKRLTDLHGGDVRLLGRIATVRLRDLGLGLANVLAGGVEVGRHDG